MNPIYNAFLYLVWFVATYYVVLILLMIFTSRDKLHELKTRSDKDNNDLVTVIVPAYNEQDKIRHTINSLKKIKYDRIEFIIISDGSKDNTFQQIKKYTVGDKKFIIVDRKNNLGKAATLNQGISIAKGKFIATIDADSIIEPDMFAKVLPYFEEEKVGAVTVSVRVKNPKTLLQKIFEIEYILGLSLLLKAFSFFNVVFVTPGPFSIYRKSVLDKIGGFDPHNITEDMEIAYRIHKNNYKIECCLDAKVYTIIPPTFKKLYVQRKRWYTGALFTMSKHRDMILSKRYGLFGLFIFLNFTVITLGLILFLSSIYISGSNMIENFLYFKYTNFNFLEQIKYFDFDLLKFSRSTILGLVATCFTFVTLIIGIYFTKTDWMKKKLGSAAFPLLFFLYQIFWVASFAAFFMKKKVKWR